MTMALIGQRIPFTSVELDQSLVLDRLEVRGTGVDLDTVHQHSQFDTLQVRGLSHDVLPREIVAALLKHAIMVCADE